MREYNNYLTRDLYKLITIIFSCRLHSFANNNQSLCLQKLDFRVIYKYCGK